MTSASSLAYWALPVRVRDQIDQKIGQVISARQIDDTEADRVTAILTTGRGRFFIKAVPDDPRHNAGWRREAAVAGHLTTIGPRLIADLAEDRWAVLLFEAVDGRPANYAPGSPDLAVAARILIRLSRLPCPDIDLFEAPLRLQQYAADTDLHRFAGNRLLHTRLDPQHLLITGTTAHLVSWGCATRGAAWLDTAYWIIELIAAGHTPAAAENLAAAGTPWRNAPATDVDAFVTASLRRHQTRRNSPNPNCPARTDAVQAWHQHRLRGPINPPP
jgi:hypothetical protein